jgi:hypothetical protein
MDTQAQFRTITLSGLASIALTLLFGGATAITAQTGGSASAAAQGGASAAAKKPDDIKVTFDDKDPSIMYVESNGERVRVNTVTKAIEQVAAMAVTPETPSTTAFTKTQDKDEPKEDFYAYETGDEPFDYRLINVPTPKKVPRGTWNMVFSHRFSQPLNPISESAKTLLGFDSMSLSSFGIMYGITDKLYLNAYRSPLCQKGLCRTIEVGLGYHITDQTEKSPVAFNVYASAEGNENFTKEYTYNFQAMISRHFGKRVYVFFAPAFHFNSNGQGRFDPRPEEYYPPATVANNFRLPRHGASFGMGTAVRITPNVAALFEFTPRTGFRLGRTEAQFDADFNVIGFKNYSQPEMGVGVQYTIGKHSFTLTLTNTQTTTTSRYNSSNLVLSPKNLVIGFNLFRRW